MFGCSVLNLTILLLYIGPMSFRTFSSFGMLSSPLPFAGVGLEMLSFSLGFALFQEAKADSKVYLSDVELKVISARGSKFLALPLGLKISILHCVCCLVCEVIISLSLCILS